MNLKSKEFKKLKTEWYGKLRKEGFKDIEQDEDHLKQWDSKFFSSRYVESVFATKEQYYRLAGQFLYDFKFESERDRTIWEMHSNAVSIREIVKRLHKAGIKTYRDFVDITIHRLRQEMIARCSTKKT